MRLTFYLFKQSIKSLEDAIKANKLKGDSAYEPIELKDSVPFEGRGFLQRNRAQPPHWLEYIGPHCNIENADELKNVTNSFLLVLRAEDRVFGVSAGFAFTAIDRRLIEPDFGLKVTLNSVATDQLRALQCRNVDVTTVQKHMVASKAGEMALFDVDFYQELLARLEGVPGKKDRSLAKSVSGADSCTIVSDVPFVKLASKCKQLLSYYRKTRYKKAFPYIGHVRPVKSEALIGQLDECLKKAIADRDAEAVSLALPDIAAVGAIEGFALKYPHVEECRIDELDVEEIYKYTERVAEPPDPLKLTVTGVRSNGDPLTSRLTLRDCAVYQVSFDDQTYVLTLGKWYEIEPDYVKDVDRRLAAQKPELVISDAGFLPPIGRTQSEGAYNTKAAASAGYVCMDKNCAPIDGVSRIEVCDLLSTSGDFIHVKRKTRSATLSHLFQQGSISATLFYDHQPYRRFIRDQLPPKMRRLITVDGPTASKFRVVYAITAGKNKALPEDLPFFSKVAILYHDRIIRRMGFRVGLYHIPIV